MKVLLTFILIILVLFGCKTERKCEVGDTVYVNYKMFIRDSVRINENDHTTHCDREMAAAPYKVILGNNEIYPQWESDILSKKAQDSSVVYVPVKDVYHQAAILDQGNIRPTDILKIVYTIVSIESN